jgi:hypothetical protein
MFFLAGAATAGAQDAVEVTLGTDIVSRYVWRGQDLGGVSLQPTLGIGYKGLSLSAWGSVGLSQPSDAKEIDLTLGYTLGGFHIGVTDYYVERNHVFEGTVGYDFGFASLNWYTNFAGNDIVGSTGKCAFSSYLEASVPFALGGVDWTATAGVVPFATDYYNARRFAVVNLALTASRPIRVTDSFSIPVFAQLALNPHSRHAFFVVGITLQP